MPCGTGTDRDPPVHQLSFRDEIGHAAMACRRSMCSEPVRPWATSTQRFAVRVIDRGHVMCSDAPASCNTQLRASNSKPPTHACGVQCLYVSEPSKGSEQSGQMALVALSVCHVSELLSGNKGKTAARRTAAVFR